MGLKAVCIHGHFYQPPREDPFTGRIPNEKGAAPYANWNERIYDQCYRPNAELGNFRNISFDIGPTLNSWLDESKPALLPQIVAQEHLNLTCYGVGNAMAQSYNHTILPLSPRRDKVTQVKWGFEEFKCRFGHEPQGMWLPEAAVNYETLEVLAECGIQFTILAPWQADAEDLDVSKPYLVDLPNGKQISVFFYEQDLSMRVSFDPGATANADGFVLNYLLPKYEQDSREKESEQMYIIASDGELYGHHQPFRDKFLAYLTDGAIAKKDIVLTYPALWLKEHPAVEKMKIRENSSWSCHHGVDRWKKACGCAPDGQWKADFRNALDQIAIEVDRYYEQVVRPYVKDVWLLRDEYYQVLCKKLSAEEFIRRYIQDSLSDPEIEKIRLMLAAQYERQRMYTSCGWFFGDLDRIEPRNNVAYAARAVWLTRKAVNVDFSTQAENWLAPVQSNRTGITADVIFREHFDRSDEMR